MGDQPSGAPLHRVKLGYNYQQVQRKASQATLFSLFFKKKLTLYFYDTVHNTSDI